MPLGFAVRRFLQMAQDVVRKLVAEDEREFVVRARQIEEARCDGENAAVGGGVDFGAAHKSVGNSQTVSGVNVTSLPSAEAHAHGAFLRGGVGRGDEAFGRAFAVVTGSSLTWVTTLPFTQAGGRRGRAVDGERHGDAFGQGEGALADGRGRPRSGNWRATIR